MFGLNLLKRSACFVFLVILFCSASFARRRHQGVWYRVRNGDTISHIARKYRVSQESIISANQIRNDRRLYVDKKLFIPEANPVLKTDGLK